jgi:hypothetical protein
VTSRVPDADASGLGAAPDVFTALQNSQVLKSPEFRTTQYTVSSRTATPQAASLSESRAEFGHGRPQAPWSADFRVGSPGVGRGGEPEYSIADSPARAEAALNMTGVRRPLKTVAWHGGGGPAPTRAALLCENRRHWSSAVGLARLAHSETEMHSIRPQ